MLYYVDVYMPRVCPPRVPHHRCHPPAASSYTCSKSVVCSQYSLCVFIVCVLRSGCRIVFRRVYIHTRERHTPRVKISTHYIFSLLILSLISTFNSILKSWNRLLIHLDSLQTDEEIYCVRIFVGKLDGRYTISLIVICQSFFSIRDFVI